MCLACDYMEMEAAWAEEEERLAAEKAAQAAIPTANQTDIAGAAEQSSAAVLEPTSR